MPKDLLERYNHLRYDSQSSAKDDFVDFLYQHSATEAPDVDVERAWNRFEKTLVSPKKSFLWLKIAASVVLLLGAGLFLWNMSTKVDQLTISSTNEKLNVTFPDGSTGMLNRHSSFVFPEKFGETRTISFEGEAYFDIIKSNKPFIIKTGDVEVKVLGTAFNLINTANSVELFVERGLVAFEKAGRQTKVHPGLKAVFSKEDDSVAIIENPSRNIMSWRSGIFEFDNTPLLMALQDLSKYYGFEFKLQNEKLGNCKITATFENRSLRDVIATIESILDVKISSNNNTVKISGKGC